uniref:Uncharacterized protein n=1 Tax=Arundo donax TaxID=35708 RepID=A0A0A8YZR7_ARUDO
MHSVHNQSILLQQESQSCGIAAVDLMTVHHYDVIRCVDYCHMIFECLSW